jgi:hypothetical protein
VIHGKSLDGNDTSIYTILHASLIPPALRPRFALLSDKELMALARLTGFVRRSARKLDLRGFLLSCMVLALQGACSLRSQALLAGLFASTTLSKQALFKRLGGSGALNFLQATLAAAISTRLNGSPTCRCANFQRVLLQDSTCLSLPARLAALFAGPSNQSGKPQASLRIQCLYDLLSERFLAFGLSPFTRNDQASACDLIPFLRPGDLVLRDLGYFSIASFKAIAAKQAFFLTRLRYGVALFDARSATAQVLDLARMLHPGQSLEIEVLLGKQEKFPVRLLAFALPQAAADQRRRKARADRDKRLSHSKAYLYLLGWNLFLTNASKERLPLAAAAKFYRLRWRVEILFKAWKSHLGLGHVSKLGRRQVEVLVYGLLLFAVLMHNATPLAGAAANAGPSARRRPPALSLIRVAQFSATWLLPLLLAQLDFHDLLRRLQAQIHAHCHYDSRRRKNYTDLRSMLLS